MPFHRSDYPANWESFSREIRFQRAKGRCECRGECGKAKPHPDVRCSARHGDISENGRGTVVLTTAHLWQGPCRCAVRNEGQKCAIRDHVKAMCQGCHLRYDGRLHRRNAAKTRLRKRGQLGFDFDKGRIG